MNKGAQSGLLPEGLHDTLPPAAEQEFAAIGKLMTCFSSHGYAQVAPPVVEFEDTLLAGVGASESGRMFRLMDPASHLMMGVRTDMTTQVARIATTRLASAPRPLRLSYAGQVLRTSGGQVRTEREFAQAGVELIGNDTVAAEAEVLLLAARALGELGVASLSIDLTLPNLVPAICDGLGIDPKKAAGIRAALDEKRVSLVEALDGSAGDIFRPLLEAAGPAGPALETLRALSLPERAQAMVERLDSLVAEVTRISPDLVLTIDPGEYRGFEYHSGIGFTLFARDVRGEIGRGGHYQVNAEGDTLEDAVGFTVYVDSLMRAIPVEEAAGTVFIPVDTAPEIGVKLRGEGWRTVGGLDVDADSALEARRIGCTHYFDGKGVCPV